MRWRMLALLFLARIGLGFQFQSLASVGYDLVVAFGLDYAGIRLLVRHFMAPGLVLALPAGYLARFMSDRKMSALGLIALAYGRLVSSLVWSGTGVGLGRVIAGAGLLFTTLYLTKMVADWFDGREIATAMSILVMSWPFGIAMDQVAHAWLTAVFDWRVPFQVASVWCLLAAAAVYVLYRAPELRSGSAAARKTGLSGKEWSLVICAGSAWGMLAQPMSFT